MVTGMTGSVIDANKKILGFMGFHSKASLQVKSSAQALYCHTPCWPGWAGWDGQQKGMVLCPPRPTLRRPYTMKHFHKRTTLKFRVSHGLFPSCCLTSCECQSLIYVDGTAGNKKLSALEIFFLHVEKRKWFFARLKYFVKKDFFFARL